MALTNNIQFYNWWPVDDFNQEWFYQFAQDRDLHNISFFSVFGDRQLIREYRQQHPQNTTVFFTGENIHNNVFGQFVEYQDHCLTDVDLSLGFDNLSAPNYLRFPLWITYLLAANSGYNELKAKIEEINSPNYRLHPNRTRFAAQISRHDTNGVRQYTIDLLNNIEVVSCAGRFANNTDELQVNYNDNKLEYLKNFKFNICPENTNVDYYVTEKIFESIMGGCIPVYWGNGDQLVEEGILNQDAILRLEHNGNNADKILTKIAELHFNQEYYQAFSQIKPFTPDAADIIWEKMESLENYLKSAMLKR